MKPPFAHHEAPHATELGKPVNATRQAAWVQAEHGGHTDPLVLRSGSTFDMRTLTPREGSSHNASVQKGATGYFTAPITVRTYARSSAEAGPKGA